MDLHDNDGGKVKLKIKKIKQQQDGRQRSVTLEKFLTLTAPATEFFKSAILDDKELE